MFKKFKERLLVNMGIKKLNTTIDWVPPFESEYIQIIKQSSNTNIRILTTDTARARFLIGESKKLGFDIITPDVQFSYFEDIDELIVDQPKLVIEKLIGKKVRV
ncbi:hypothetical protein ACH0B5_15335 [Ureibacillus sp. 179-F W5.1 NHS]|uniref:hypothetical protein n=1 Tax=Ureibacillus sp. 179-F W5.1 NHS TaxID=3374297 RepID=UPI0038790A91